MKKNVKILGAAAAALLAIAPVAASTTTANAAGPEGGNTGIYNPALNGNKDHEAEVPQNVNIVANKTVKPGTVNTYAPLAGVGDFSFTNAASGANYGLPVSGFQVLNVSSNSNIYKGTLNSFSELNSSDAIQYGAELKAGQSYTQVISATVLTPKAGLNYTFNGKASSEVSSEAQVVTNVPVFVHFTVQDSNISGNPFVAQLSDGVQNSFADGHVVSAHAKNINSVESMTNAINGLNLYTHINSSDVNGTRFTATGESVRDQLTKAGVKIASDGTFTLPENGFYYTVTATNPQNGRTATARVFFSGQDTATKGYPVIAYRENGDSAYTPIKQGNRIFNYMPIVQVTQGDTNWKPYTNFASTEILNSNAPVMRLSTESVASNDVNVNVPGMYHVTLNVTNSDGKTTQLTYTVVVRSGDPQAVSSVTVDYAKGYGVNLWHLYGNKPSYVGSRAQAGSSLTVYINQTKTVNGVSYTRVKTDDDEPVYIQTQYIDGSWTAAQNANKNNNTSTKPVSSETAMSGVAHVTYKGKGGVNLLNADGKYQNQYVKKGTNWKVFAKKTINGETMYRLGTQNQWIPAQYVSVR